MAISSLVTQKSFFMSLLWNYKKIVSSSFAVLVCQISMAITNMDNNFLQIAQLPRLSQFHGHEKQFFGSYTTAENKLKKLSRSNLQIGPNNNNKSIYK